MSGLPFTVLVYRQYHFAHRPTFYHGGSVFIQRASLPMTSLFLWATLPLNPASACQQAPAMSLGLIQYGDSAV